MTYCKRYEKMQKKYNRYRMLGMGDRLGKILENTMYKHLLNCKVCNAKGNENEVHKWFSEI